MTELNQEDFDIIQQDLIQGARFDFPCSYTWRCYEAMKFEGIRLPDIEPTIDSQERPFIPRPIVNVTYQMGARSTPAFTELNKRIRLLEGRLTKYFEGKSVKRTYYK